VGGRQLFFSIDFIFQFFIGVKIIKLLFGALESIVFVTHINCPYCYFYVANYLCNVLLFPAVTLKILSTIELELAAQS